MTDEEKEVIDAAKEWNKAATPENRVCLSNAVDALPKPYEPLVSDDELQDLSGGRLHIGQAPLPDGEGRAVHAGRIPEYLYLNNTHRHMRAAIVLALRRMSKRLAVVGYEGASNMVARASQEEEVQ